MEKQSASKNTGISCLRIFATIAILWLHTAGTVAEANPLIEQDIRRLFKFLQIMMNWAVPVFFMITGSLMLNPAKEITAEKCIKKYAARIFTALLLFGIPFAALILIFEGGSFSAETALNSVTAVFTGGSFSHLWYLYVLIGIYLILPVLRAFVKNASQKDLLLVTAVLFVFDFVFPTISSYAGIQIEFSVPFTYPLFYLLMGYYISAYKPAALCNKLLNGAVTAVFCLCVLIFVYNDISLACFYYDGVLTGIAAAAVFSSFTICGNYDKCRKPELLWKIDRLCFGVYLIHPVFIQFSYRFLKLTPASFDAYYIAFIPFFIVFTLCSFFASWVMSLIKPLKKYVL